MRNWNNFCGMLAILLCISIQTKAQHADNVKIKKDTLQVNYSPVFNKYSLPHPLLGNSSKKISINSGSPFAHWGFMCIGEYKLEQRTGIPLRIRLGSLDYVNKLEGKQ